jgi:hypothetical protein
MAKLANSLRTDSEFIHNEHEVFTRELKELEFALQALVCYSEVFANLASAAEVARHGRQLSRVLPGHFRIEEKTVLADLAKRGPELRAFVEEMKRQHHEIGKRLAKFCRLVDDLETSEDVEETICQMKERGLELARQMTVHMAAEERKLSSLEN